jgi:sulfate-transporting ATPase
VYAAYADENADFDALAEEQGKLEAIISAAADNVELQLEMAADALRLPPWDAKIGVLSGGEKRRVALCRLLLSKPDMLLLDEPTNHLDAESVDWLEQFLLRFPGTVVAITHDRYFLDNAAEWILELDAARHSVERQLLFLAGSETGSPEAGRSNRICASESLAERAGMGASESESTSGEK